MKVQQIAGRIGATAAVVGIGCLNLAATPNTAQAQPQTKRPNIVMLMTDDTGWGDFGCYL
jgi:hypothetical protein